MSRFYSNGISRLILSGLRIESPNKVREALVRAGAVYPDTKTAEQARKDVAHEMQMKRDLEQNERAIVMLTLCGHGIGTIQEVFGCGHSAVSRRLNAGGLGVGRRGRRSRGDILRSIKARPCQGSR